MAFFYSVGPRFVLEAALLGGFLVVGGIAVVTQGVTEAVSAIGLFAVAGFRVVPCLTRLQSVFATMHAHEPNAHEVLDALRETGATDREPARFAPVDPVGLPPGPSRSSWRTSPSPTPAASAPPWTRSRRASPPGRASRSSGAPARASRRSSTSSWAC